MSKKIKYLLSAGLIIVIALYFFGGTVAQRIVYPLQFRSIIIEESQNFKLEPALVAAVIFEESKFDERAKSKAGAIGLMQLMPDTAEWIAKNLNIDNFKVNDLYIPKKNIKFGCWYLRFLLGKYGREDLALAAYNSGHQNVDKWLKQEGMTKEQSGEIRLGYGETKHYIKKVRKTKELYNKIYGNILN